jgi:hypothetical protein
MIERLEQLLGGGGRKRERITKADPREWAILRSKPALGSYAARHFAVDTDINRLISPICLGVAKSWHFPARFPRATEFSEFAPAI